MIMLRVRVSQVAVGVAVATAALLGCPGTPRAAEPHVFAAALLGEPEVGCIVTSGGAGCAGDRVSGTLAPDGDPSFVGRFAFVLPGFRDDAGGPLRHGGRGRLVGTFTPAGAAGRTCVLKGRVRVQGVFVPAGASTRRFHTGTFVARGRCDGGTAHLKAIWSGAIDSVDEGGMFLDFERFQGRLAGRLVLK
jgi:hypothetical protein